MRKSLVLLLSCIALAAAAAAVVFLRSSGERESQSTPAQSQPQKSTQTVGADPLAAPLSPPPTATVPEPAPPAVPALPQRTLPAAPAAPPRPEPSPHTRQLVNELTQLNFTKGPLTPEQAAAWKSTLDQLVQQGAGAVPAIREFLEKNQDMRFDPAQGGNLLGQPTMRMALLNALQSIGGPEALELSLQTLQTTTQPREIALLAQSLEQQAPDQHRETILNAARESLNMAASGRLPGTDVGPLFSVLQQYGGAQAIGDLQKFTSPYRYYSAIALAGMPEGAGVSALQSMLREPNGPPKPTHTTALEALAQVAPAQPQALASLIEQAKLNQIPDATWINVAEGLAGRRTIIGDLAAEGYTPASGDKTYHLAYGNQNFYSTLNAPLTAEQITERMAAIDQLMPHTTSPVGTDALQKARALLQARQPSQ